MRTAANPVYIAATQGPGPAQPISYRLFPSTNGPASPVNYSGNFISGVGFEVDPNGVGIWFQGYWWWCCPSGQSTAPVKCALWAVTDFGSVSGVNIAGATVTSGTLAAGGWNYVPLATPVQLAIGTPYIAGVGVNGSFPDTANSFGSGQPYAAGIVNGPLGAYSAQSGSLMAPYNLPQGLYTTGGTDPSVTIPTQQSGTDNLWVDVQVGTGIPSGYAGSYRMWPNKWDSSPTTTGDSALAYVVATEFHLSRTCTLNKIWYYSTSGTTQLATHALVYSILGVNAGNPVASIASPSWSGAAGSGWVSASFTGGTTLPAGSYKVAIYNSAGTPVIGWSGTQSHYYDSGGKGQNGITWGPVTSPSLATASIAYEYDSGGGGDTPPFSYPGGATEPGQATFAQLPNGTPSPVYPYLYVDGLAQSYWVDIEVT